MKNYIIRSLTSSDLGWFGVLRKRGAVASRQRALNINAAIIVQTLPQQIVKSGHVLVNSKCAMLGVDDNQVRPLSRVGKNWRLGGKKVKGDAFSSVVPGDLFLMCLDAINIGDVRATWCVVGHLDPRYDQIQEIVESRLSNSMLCTEFHGELGQKISEQFPEIRTASEDRDSIPRVTLDPLPRKPHRLSVKQRLEHPQVWAEMLRVSLSLSADVQRNFISVLEGAASFLRELLEAEGLIRSIPIDHGALWALVKERPIAFVDGGTAMFSSLGAEPIAIRVGSYVVVPGREGPDRERFTIEKQLVDELFEGASQGGVYEEFFEDSSKLRDVARISLEAAGAVEVLRRSPKPEFVYVHGALVNPVSSYALQNFPNFTNRALGILLGGSGDVYRGQDRNFVSVYLKQLQVLSGCGASVVGVVERPSPSRIVTETLLDQLKECPSSPGTSRVRDILKGIQEYRITDAVLFHSILNEGEYISPVPIDRNDPARAPAEWKDLISQFPKPFVTYVGVGEMSLPLRVELFKDAPEGTELPIRIVLHAARLMPQYAFPAGLDIVDKFAKVPNWMSKPINDGMAVQFLKRALSSGDPRIIREAKRLLCGTTRDFLFRPTFNER